MDRESGDYLEGNIRTQRNKTVHSLVIGSSQGGTAVAALQRAFLGHHLSKPAE